jgi:hypothetical protein
MHSEINITTLSVVESEETSRDRCRRAGAERRKIWQTECERMLGVKRRPGMHSSDLFVTLFFLVKRLVLMESRLFASLRAIRALLGATILLVTGCSEPSPSGRISEVTAPASPLIKAIESYRRDNEKLPSKLSELVPRYVSAIPTSPDGSPNWNYYTWGSSDTGFHYGFEVRYSRVILRYSSQSAQWTTNDAGF